MWGGSARDMEPHLQKIRQLGVAERDVSSVVDDCRENISKRRQTLVNRLRFLQPLPWQCAQQPTKGRLRVSAPSCSCLRACRKVKRQGKTT